MPITDAESFESGYFYFLKALRTLAASPGSQCSAGDNFNVAWELKIDVAAGESLLDSPAATFSPEQAHAVRQLMVELDKIPPSVLREALGEAENLKATNHACWKPLRKHAALLLRVLHTET